MCLFCVLFLCSEVSYWCLAVSLELCFIGKNSVVIVGVQYIPILFFIDYSISYTSHQSIKPFFSFNYSAMALALAGM